MPHLQVGVEHRVDGVGALVVLGPDEAETNIRVDDCVLGQVAAILVLVHLAVLCGARVLPVHFNDALLV